MLENMIRDMREMADSWESAGTEGATRSELADAVSELVRMWQTIDGVYVWPFEKISQDS